MSSMVKELSPHFTSLSLVFYRSIFGVTAIFIFLKLKNSPNTRFPKGSIHRVLIFRSLTGFIGILCLYYGVSHLPLPVASTINWSSPIFVIVLSRIILKEKLKPKAMIWIFIAFISLSGLFGQSLMGFLNQTGVIFSPLALGIAVLGSFAGASAYVAVRAATAKVDALIIVLYFLSIATVLSAPFVFLSFKDSSAFLANDWVKILAMGFFGTSGQITMTHAYRLSSAGIVSAMGLLNAVFSALVGWWFFSENLGLLQWGSLLLLGLAVLMVSLPQKAVK